MGGWVSNISLTLKKRRICFRDAISDRFSVHENINVLIPAKALTPCRRGVYHQENDRQVLN